jgi:hypothetical protein
MPIQALRYNPEGRGFDSRRCHWNFSLTQSFRPHSGPGDDSACNRNEYQEYFLGGKGGRCVQMITLPPSCADCLEIREPQFPATLRTCPGLFRHYITLYRRYLLYFHCYSTRFLASELETLLLNIAEIASTSIGRNCVDITEQFYLRMETDPVFERLCSVFLFVEAALWTKSKS